jgi:hypothetical protein
MNWLGELLLGKKKRELEERNAVLGGELKEVLDRLQRLKESTVTVEEFDLAVDALRMANDNYISLHGMYHSQVAAKEAAIRQARIWAQEARTQESTVLECYKAAGVTGRMTWNGATPVRDKVKQLKNLCQLFVDDVHNSAQPMTMKTFAERLREVNDQLPVASFFEGKFQMPFSTVVFRRSPDCSLEFTVIENDCREPLTEALVRVPLMKSIVDRMPEGTRITFEVGGDEHQTKYIFEPGKDPVLAKVIPGSIEQVTIEGSFVFTEEGE